MAYYIEQQQFVIFREVLTMRLSYKETVHLLVAKLVRRNLILDNLGSLNMLPKKSIFKILVKSHISLRLISNMLRENHSWMLHPCKVRLLEDKNRKLLSRYVPLCHNLSKKSLIFRWDILIQKL